MEQVFGDDYYQKEDENLDEIEDYIERTENDNEEILKKADNEDEENENDDENDLKAKENVTKVDHNSILTGKTSISIGNKMQLDSR